ncbi:MAG: tetratricopeptide repeat protein [Planctomycetes bacterium]|nr:tetratricopeptide repeat protein [Planctomycetota bacterium]
MIFPLYLLLAGGTAFAFADVMHLEFVRYDDDHMIFENPRVVGGLTREGLQLAWTGPHMGNWHPLTTLSHLIDCQLFGVERPGWHHLVSLCFHVGSTLLLFEAFRRMTGEVWPSALVAALFAVHPLRVESVAWAAERKDVLSGFFWMLTLLAYVWYARNPGIMKYLFCSLALCCALLSKPTTVTLPFVLLLVDWWPLRRWRRKQKTEDQRVLEVRFPEQCLSRLVTEKIPFLVAAIAAGGFAALVQSHDVVDHPTLAQLPMSWRLVNANMAYVSYLWKSVWPVNLAVLHPHPGLANGANLASWVLPALGGGLLLLGMTAWAYFVAPRRPYLLVGWLWYLGTLVPMIGLFQVGWQGYADRYTYLPMIGIYVAISWGARDLVHYWPKAKYPVALLATVWLLALMVLTGRQLGYWRSSQTLFEHALEATADNPIMHNSYGNALDRLGQLDKAIEQYRKAVELKPDYAMAHYNLGISLSEVGDYGGAVAELRKASQLDPKAVAPHNNLGSALLKQGQTEQAIQEYREAVRLKPDFSTSRYNLANALQSAGQDVIITVNPSG